MNEFAATHALGSLYWNINARKALNEDVLIFRVYYNCVKIENFHSIYSFYYPAVCSRTMHWPIYNIIGRWHAEHYQFGQIRFCKNQRKFSFVKPISSQFGEFVIFSYENYILWKQYVRNWWSVSSTRFNIRNAIF